MFPAAQLRAPQPGLGPLLPPAMRPGPQHHHGLEEEKAECSCVSSGYCYNFHPSMVSRSRSSPAHPQRQLTPRGSSPCRCRHLSGLCSQFPSLRQPKQVYSRESFQERYFHVIMKGFQAQKRIFSKLHPLLCCFKIHLPSSKYCQCSEKLDHSSCKNG